MSSVINMIFGTPLERAQKAYGKHSRKYNECTSKAEEARSNGNYDYAESKTTEADSHLSMMNYYDKLIQKIMAQEADKQDID